MNWNVGDRVAWKTTSGIVRQGIVQAINSTETLAVKIKGEKGANHAVSVSAAKKSIAEFAR